MKINQIPINLPKYIGLDIETQWAYDNEPDPYRDLILTIQLFVPGDDTYILTNDFTRLQSILENEAVVFVIHNASFDSKFILHQLGIEIKNVFDTLQAERILTAGKQESSSLESVAQRRLGIQLNKSARRKFHKNQIDNDLLEYAVRDAEVLIPIYEQQQEELKQEGLEFVADLENRLSLVVGKIELNGIGFDIQQWNSVLKEERETRDKVYREIVTEFGMPSQVDLFGDFHCDLNLNSRSSVLGLLRKKGIYLEDYRKDTLVRYLRQYPGCTILTKLLEYKEHEKRLSWDYPKYINPKTNRIHPNISQIGARTGRFAFSNPNLQQVPREESFRKMFIAEKGNMLITADYSQIELRVLAEEAGDKAMIAAFKSGVDFHQRTAELIAQNLHTRPDRAFGKNCNFAAIYGSSAEGLAASTGIPVKEWRKILKSYFNAYPALNPWYEKSFSNLIKNGYCTTLSGRKRWFPELDPTNPNKYRNISRNTPIQGGALDIIKLALIYVDKAIKGYDARIVHTIHDEILVEVEESQAEKAAKIVQQSMVEAGQFFLKQVPVEVDIQIASYWK